MTDEFEMEVECPVCKGTGADPMSDIVNWLPCTRCKGIKTIVVPDEYKIMHEMANKAGADGRGNDY